MITKWLQCEPLDAGFGYSLHVKTLLRLCDQR